MVFSSGLLCPEINIAYTRPRDKLFLFNRGELIRRPLQTYFAGALCRPALQIRFADLLCYILGLPTKGVFYYIGRNTIRVFY
jgi:hypothetical protein